MEQEISDLPKDDVSDVTPKNSVSYDTYKRVLEQRKKDQADKELLAARLAEFEAEKSRIEEEKARQEGNWKSLVESRDLRLKQLEEERNQAMAKAAAHEETLSNAVKLNVFQNKLGGRLKKSEYLSFVDTTKIPVDPETGAVDDNAAEQYAREFAKNFRELVVFDDAGKMPNGSPRPSQSISYEQWKSLPIKEKKAKYKDVFNKP